MNLLIGIPAFRIACQLRRCLDSMLDTPATVLVVDNAADADVKQVIADYRDRIEVVRHETNGFCNGGWNATMTVGLAGDFDVIGLGSSDATLIGGWYEGIERRLKTRHKEVWIPALRPAIADENVTSGLAGYFSFLPRAAVELVFPIPLTLKHWFGDQYMFEKLRADGWKTVVANDVRARHEQGSVTHRTPEAKDRIEADKRAWAELQLREHDTRMTPCP